MAVSPLLPVAAAIGGAIVCLASFRREAILDVTVEYSLEGFISAVTINLDDFALSKRLSTFRLK
jgi:hypothetical protein